MMSKVEIKNKKIQEIFKYFYVVIGCFLTAFAFNVFFAPNNIVTYIKLFCIR